MAFDNKPLNALIEADFQNLITTQTAEGKTIDYKVKLPGTADADVKEFLYDVSSFANTVGGHLIFGVTEEGGLPTGFPGLPGLDADKEKLRLESMIRNGIEPRIAGINIEAVQLTGVRVLVMQIPRSWAAPHVVKHSGTFRFYARNSAGKYPLDVFELRTAFLAASGATESARAFRIDRVSKIISGDTPVGMSEGAKLILHLIPLSAFNAGVNYDLSAFLDPHNANSPLSQLISSNVGISLNPRRFNFDGALAYEKRSEETPAQSYLQVFRNGVIEFVTERRLGYRGNSGILQIAGTAVEELLLKLIPHLIAIYKWLGVDVPVFVTLSVVGVKGYVMYILQKPGAELGHTPEVIDRNELLLPEILIEDFGADFGSVMKPVFDALWNAAGWFGSISYDKDGKWQQPR